MGSPDFDPYATLGVVPSATPDEIRAAYRRLAAVFHPDLQPLEKRAWASERMVQLNAARDLLLDTRRRVQYHRENADRLRWKSEKTRWRAREAHAAYTHPPVADQPPPRSRDQIYALIVFSAAGLVIVGIVVLLGLGRGPGQLFQAQQPAWVVAVQQAMSWTAAFAGFFLAALQVLFLSGILALIVFSVTHWLKR